MRLFLSIVCVWALAVASGAFWAWQSAQPTEELAYIVAE